jgi:hypothetical protein
MKRALACLALLAVLVAQARAQPTGAAPIKLAVRPAAAPSPALKYELLPPLKDQTPGNAAFLYYRSFSPDWWGNVRQPKEMEKIHKALETPIKELRDSDLKWLRGWGALKEVDRAARREYLDWELTQRIRETGIALLLPDIQNFREVATLLAVRARLEMATGDLDAALATLQTGFALARHVQEGPTLIQALVGLAIAQVMLTQLEELIQQPGAPNLYWALTSLPRPFGDLRKPLGGEKLMLYGTLHMLRDVETTPLTAPQQEPLLKALGGVAEEIDGPVAKPGWPVRLLGVAYVLRAYPAARQALIAEGRKPADVEALPALQVVILHALHEYQRLQDDVFKWCSVPYAEARPHLIEAERQIKLARQRLEGIPFTELLPGMMKVVFAGARTDRRIAALRCIEAVRLSAAAHDGKLPAALADITAVPVPADPVTGKAFAYQASGDKVTLSAPPPEGEKPSEHNTIHYELTFRR